jgi:ABC-2 type transport system permease protein
MAVHKKIYRRYEGAYTPAWSRFLILPRYSFEEMRGRRFFGLFFLGTFIWPVVCALVIYLHHNLSALEALKLDPSKIIRIDSGFFLFYLGFQSMLSFFLAVFVGPGLVSADLANNALPLYLARPFSRAEYVLGRMSVLVILLSVMTWVPGLLLFGFQSYLAGAAWREANGRIAGALLLGSWIWILVVSLLVLALSAWVKWKPLAGGLLFLVFFLGGALGNAANELLRTHWGQLINLSHLIGTVWLGLFGQPAKLGAGAVFFRVQARGGLTPDWAAWGALIGLCLLCLALLSKKIRGIEVSR